MGYIYDRNEQLAQKVMKGLKKRHMTGYYAANKEEALKKALELIPEGAKVAMGGCTSAVEIGLEDALKTGNYNYIDRHAAKDKNAAMREAFHSDFFIMSANAMTEDGEIVNIDGNGNRVAALCFGPDKVLMIVGMNKIAVDLDAAMKRARNFAAPVNSRRIGISSPCVTTGSCHDCLAPDSICSQFLVTRMSRYGDRIHVILVNDSLGY